MKNRVCDMVGVEFPILAFSHCRDVIAAVSNAGGFGVLGAVAHTPEQLEIDLAWIEAETNGKPYGVDLLLPDDARRELGRRGGMSVSPRGYEPLLDVAFAHRMRLIASALGPPPPELIERAHANDVVVAALAGRASHAARHHAAGVDLIVAQGTEAGGHTGEVATMVLIPEVVGAVTPTPVIAAGGIGNGRQIAAAMALGAEGVWCGSVWLATEEAETHPGGEAEVPRRHLQRHGSVALAHRQTGTHAPQRVDRGVGARRRAAAARHAAAKRACR